MNAMYQVLHDLEFICQVKNKKYMVLCRREII